MNAFQDGHHIALLSGGEQYFAALATAMEGARDEVYLESYIFDFTGSARGVAQSLIRCAQRGVKVHLLVDGVGTDAWPLEWQQRFDAAGVQWHIYNPLGRLGLLLPSRWRRLHRKLCVVDGGSEHAIGFCGGINVLDDYHDPNHGALVRPRYDFAMQVQGPLVSDIADAMRSLWQRVNTFSRLRKHPIEAAQAGLSSARRLLSRPEPKAAQPTQDLSITAHHAKAALLLRDNVLNRKRIEKAYLKAIGEAKQEVIICCAYFLPGGKLRKALLTAAKRGVKVRLLLQGRYEYFMQFHAARPVYETMLKAGVEIHEYAASFLHAKVAVIDAYSAKAWATVGSSNLDPLSLLLAREANVVVLDPPFARDLRERLVRAMSEDGESVQLEALTHRPWHERLLDRAAYGLMRLALMIAGRRY
jgi:cardiolipin synthase A/B